MCVGKNGRSGEKCKLSVTIERNHEDIRKCMMTVVNNSGY